MKDNSIDKLKQQLFNEADGVKFSNLKDKLLKKYATTDRATVLEIFTQYVKEGKILHWREFLLTDIIDLIEKKEYIEFFEWTITVPKLTYWGIDGLLKSCGSNSYNKLIALIKSDDQPVSIKAKAIKSISSVSKQPFDSGLADDPEYWSADDIRINDILKWQKDGYPNGQGYSTPKTHFSLNNPKSELEKLISKLDKKLEVKRSKNKDLSNPSNWLVIAEESDILNIQKKWTLPESYFQFIKYYSPIKVFINSKKHFQGINLYGASNLIKSQHGYSYNPVTNQQIKEWPKNFLVIADTGADPFCIDLNNIKKNNAPIYKSIHGEGKWKFELYANSFIDFLKELSGK
jgi:SMI1 / KNR4 family (SUKH-1)